MSLLPRSAAGQTSQPATSAPSVTVMSPDAIDRLIHDLSSPRWSVREAASNALMDAGTAAYRALRSEFRETNSYEIRRRIRAVAKEIYMAEVIGPPHAFLGISHNRGAAIPAQEDQRVPLWASGLLITNVIHGTAAYRAGLHRDDLIMAINGRTGMKNYPAIEFTQWIASQKPGTVCLLNVIRGGEGVRLDGGSVPNFTPSALAKAKIRVLRHEDDPRIPYVAAGILIEDVGPVDRILKRDKGPHVAAGDLLLALNDEIIPLEGTVEHFQKWCQGDLPLKTPDLPAAPGDPSAPRQPSAHLLRGGQGFDMEISLGRRPAYVDSRPPARGADPTPYEQAIHSFEAWWQETFDPDGVFSDSADEDSRWDLEPRWGGR